MVTMDETNTANSSSAAAVADGASAAARTKTVGASTIKSASHVKLLIKSSNQQYEDHVIESDLLWTVKRLKTHLSVVYPSKPPAADQKLIYSGQLLNDNVQLKDVIRSYKDVYTQNHIIHLVYTPKNLPSPPVTSSANKTKTTTSSGSATGAATAGQASANNMTTADGLRQRHTAGSNSTGSQSTAASMQQQQQQQQAMFHQNMYPYFMTPQMMSPITATAAMHSCPQFPPALGSPYNVQAMISQQAAMYNWMQQVYSQYMQQCLRLSNTVDSSTVPSMAATPFRPAIPPEFHQFFQQQFPSTVMPPIVPGPTNIATANIAASTDGSTAEGQQDQQQQQQQQGQQEPAALGQVAAPRFPNLPQDEHDNRDWLDNFFSITRLALFLTLLYFNSSPLRCLVVVIIAGGIYLYHIGAFRLRHERNNNNLNRNNNAAQNAAVDQIRQGVDQQQNAVAAPANQGQEGNNAENNNSDDDEPVQQTETTTSSDAVDNADNESMMSTIRTFVITFFTSLFPETPAL